MASFFSFLLLLLLLLGSSSTPHVHGRESQFFSKAARRNPPPSQETNNPLPTNPFPNPTPVQTSVAQAPPTKDEEDPLAPETEENDHGYGLYGRHAPTTHFAPPTTDYDSLHSKDFAGAAAAAFVDSRKSDEKGSEQQLGMSDTRFLENGKYFYDVEAEKQERGGAYRSTTTGSNTILPPPELYEEFADRRAGAGGSTYGYGGEGYGRGIGSSFDGYMGGYQNQKSSYNRQGEDGRRGQDDEYYAP